MKGRSQRLQTANQPDDWVDGSWTVDCICGVNFDDGEEMVKCDECGVWVHTRCSRYVKEEELFTCDKCKNKNSRTDIEETEVAQFLVELPTKTVRIESNYAASGPAKKPPFRIWTENPVEEKVHVQGIPGGDPGLFSGLSSVFSQQLWKCTGYVPKKFNFQYKEFPCWDADKEEVANVEEDNENAVDKGAGVLFSLSKESIRASPVTTIMRTRTKVADVSNDRKARSKEAKKSDLGAGDVRRSQNGARKEKSLHRPFIVYSGKRKKEECGVSKDLSGKKKARIIDKDLDTKKRAAHASRAVFTPTSDAKQLEFYEDRGAKSFKTDIQSVKHRNLRDTLAVEPISDSRIAVSKTDEIPKNDVADTLCVPEGSSAELIGHDQDILAKDKIPHNVSGVNSSAEEVASGVGCNGTGGVCEMKVGENCIADNSNGASSDKVLNLLEKSKADASPEIKDTQTSSEMMMDTSLASQKPNVKTEVDNDSGGLLNSISASLADANSLKMSPDTVKSTKVVSEDKSGTCKGTDLVVSSLHCGDKKLIDAARESSESKVQQDVDFSVDPLVHKEEPNGPENSNMLRKSLSEPKQTSGDDELSKSGVTVSSAAPSSKLKVAVSLGKSSPTGSSIIISKSSSSNKSKPKPSGARNVLLVGNQVAADCRDHASSDTTADEGKQDALRKTEKERSSRIFHTSAPKRNASDSKDCAVPSTSKSSSAQNILAGLGSADSTRMLQNQSPLPAPSRAPTSGLSQKVGKSNHTTFHPSLKGGHTPAAQQPVVSNPPAGLSDEELALLLHQELNSSPRVPRVPRVRQASLPQLASQAASTVHVKRTSSSGTKDQNLVPKRKVKEFAKDRATYPREVEDEARKTGKATSSSDQRRQDRLSSGDTCVKEAKGSPAHVHSFKKNASPLSTSANSGPSSSNEANDVKRPSRLASPMSNSDDDFTADQPPVYRTLPGLINEIMSKGRRMTYEELCDAVLPHWASLRKHNGERYAYSSHSQAVLDCLRNRHEWAQLVDRGPKTNSSRKRRRVDSQDFEDDKDSKQRSSRDRESKRLESQRDDFPKGKRNARKRRRLALQGRDIKDLRKADILTDDDDGAFSNSTTKDSMFSEEDEIQGGGGGDASSGSEEVRDS